jgi:hypothetical protein
VGNYVNLATFLEHFSALIAVKDGLTFDELTAKKVLQTAVRWFVVFQEQINHTL